MRARLRGGVLVTLLIGLLASLLAGGPVASATDTAGVAADGRRSHEGTIDGAKFRAEVPERWNGTLVMFSHGYYPPVGFPEFPVALTNHPTTEQWLLDHGYALAASDFKDRTGYQVKQGYHDQLALLDWFEENVGRPGRTVSMGQSLGAAIAVLLAERNPHRFDGVVTACGEYDPQATFNTALDLNFAVKTLLARPGQDIDLVRPRDPAQSTLDLLALVEEARATPQGRAKLALAGALGNIADWYSTYEPQPTELADRILQQSRWVSNAYIWGLGPNARADLEPRAGGNPSWNVGVDYRHQLARSARKDLVRKAYREAGLDLRADLDKLAAAPRIAADPEAVAFIERWGIPRGTTPTPVISVHNTGDGGAVPDQERWYARQVRRSGDPTLLRQLYVDRGSHCAFTAAEEIVTLRALFERMATGRWPRTDPRRLNAAAGEFGSEYQIPVDFLTGRESVVSPGFTHYVPPRPLRPSR